MLIMDESTTSNMEESANPSYDSAFESVAQALEQYGIKISTDGETVTYDSSAGAGALESVNTALAEYGLSASGEGSDSQEANSPQSTDDLGGTPWGALKGIGGIETLGDVFAYVGGGNPSTGSSGSSSTDGSSGDSSSQEGNSQPSSDQFAFSQSPWGRLSSVGIDSYEGVFGGAGGGGSNPMGGGSNPSAGGGSGSPFGGGSGGPSSDLPYGGNPFAGDNFWNIFAGGVNPSNIGSGGGFGGGSMSGEDSTDSGFGGGSMSSGFGGGGFGGGGFGGGFGR